MPLPAPQQNYRYSPAVVAKASVDVAVGGIADLTWNGFWRNVYEKTAQAIDRQANELAARGTLSKEEATRLAVSQRNALVLQIRNQLTSFGRFYSEKLKPAKDMPTFEALLAKKGGSFEAIISGASKTRRSVNRLAFAARASGPALITLDIVLTIVVIDQAPSSDRGRVAARQIGGIAGSVAGARYGGLAGA